MTGWRIDVLIRAGARLTGAAEKVSPTANNQALDQSPVTTVQSLQFAGGSLDADKPVRAIRFGRLGIQRDTIAASSFY
jgi:hypothetical protein